jgi:catechol 2,3-dioxygenase-like lactoylglutathione lyase family enzyme
MTNATAGIATLGNVVLDCPDPLALAEFYGRITGWPLDDGSEPSWAQIESPTGFGIAFQGVEDYVAPRWPSSEQPQQFHLDFYLADLDAGEQRVLEWGATKADHQPGTSFRVFLDPAGHPFCLCKG